MIINATKLEAENLHADNGGDHRVPFLCLRYGRKTSCLVLHVLNAINSVVSKSRFNIEFISTAQVLL